MNRLYRLLSGLIFAAAAGGVLVAVPERSNCAAEQPADRTCYRLVKTDTVCEHPDDKWGLIEWGKWHTVKGADGDYTTTSTRLETGRRRTWQVSLKKQLAIVASASPEFKGSLKITWTAPPPLWCSDQDCKMSITTRASGPDCTLWGGGIFKPEPNETVANRTEGKVDPWGGEGVLAGKPSGEFVMETTGVSIVRPKPNQKPFVLKVRMSEGDADYFWVNYYYEPAPKETSPAPGTPLPMPMKSGDGPEKK